MSALKACPFCGSRDIEDDADSAVVYCNSCRAEVHGDSPKKAVTAWNTRAPSAEKKSECEDDLGNPCADALDRLWKEIILKRNPNYGDWEYPGQAYRHLLAEFRALEDKLAGLTPPEGT